MKRFLLSFQYAFRGVALLIQSQRNAQGHLAGAVLVIGAGLFFRIENWEWCVSLLCIGVVFSAEGFNSAIEKLCDYVQPQFHPVIGQIKDLSAGATLLAGLGAIACGCLIFLPKVWRLFFSYL